MKITVTQTDEGPRYCCDDLPITWRDVREATGLDRSLSRLLLKKLAQSGENVDDLVSWRDRQVLIWKLEAEMTHAAA